MTILRLRRVPLQAGPQQETDPSLIPCQVLWPISVAGAARNNPALGLAGEVGDKLEVGVVVQYGE